MTFTWQQLLEVCEELKNAQHVPRMYAEDITKILKKAQRNPLKIFCDDMGFPIPEEFKTHALNLLETIRLHLRHQVDTAGNAAVEKLLNPDQEVAFELGGENE